MKEQKLYFILKALSLVGILLALFLLWEQMFRPAFQPCTINATINCDAVISGTLAKTFGIPTPLYGLAGYSIIFIAAMYRKKKLLLSAATFGLVFCLWIAFKELFELHVICPVCILCQLIMVTVFGIGSVLFRRKG